jgi:hypothetical protein
MLSTLADGVLGTSSGIARCALGRQATASMSANLVSAARLGDGPQTQVVITRMGRNLAYA